MEASSSGSLYCSNCPVLFSLDFRSQFIVGDCVFCNILFLIRGFNDLYGILIEVNQRERDKEKDHQDIYEYGKPVLKRYFPKSVCKLHWNSAEDRDWIENQYSDKIEQEMRNGDTDST